MAALVLLAYSAWVGIFLARDHSIWSFVHLGSDFAARAPAGSPMRAGLGDASVTPTGYDGQFVYYLAVAPLDAACCLDSASYRYARVGLPVVSGLAAVGQAAAVPYATVGVNLLALAGTVLLLAGWLRRRGVSAWWALAYGFYPGVFQVVQTDTNEVLACLLVAAGVYALEGRRKAGLLSAGALFAAAALTRETVLLFPAVYSAALVLGQPARRRDGILLATAAAGPFLVYKLVLAAHFGSLGVGFGNGGGEVAAWPLGGLLSFWPLEPREWIEVAGEVAPATLLAVLAVVRLVRAPRRRELVLYLVNYVVLVLLLQRSSYFSYYDSGRIQTSLVLAALLALPALLPRPAPAEPRTRRTRAAAGAPVIAAVLLWLVVVPVGLLAPHSFHVFKL